MPKEDAEKAEILEKLEQHIAHIEKRIQKSSYDCDVVKNENAYLQKKIENTEIKYTNLAIIVSEVLENEQAKIQNA